MAPALVIREGRHKNDVGDAGSVKRNEFSWIAKRAAKFIDRLGHNRVTVKCDNEPAIEALPREIARACQEEGQTVLEKPQVEEGQSNGIVERAVGLVASQARTLKATLEHRIGVRVPSDARIFCWLVEFAAYLMNRCDIGSDGKTPLHRLHEQKKKTHRSWNSERRSCTCLTNQQGEESGNRDSILECLLAS